MGTLCCVPEVRKSKSLVDALFPYGIIAGLKTDCAIERGLPAAVIQCIDEWMDGLFNDVFRTGLGNQQFSPECSGYIGKECRRNFYRIKKLPDVKIFTMR